MFKNNNWFLNEIMLSILHDYRIPKVQIERSIESILNIFIENIVQSIFRDENSIRLISNEFPFKKENNQSTNADFLLQGNEVVYIVELKTSSSSYKTKQLDRYIEIKNKIELEKSAKFLVDDLSIIQQASNENEKYEFLINEIKNKTSLDFTSINRAEILYIAPENTRRKLNDKNIKFISYTELSNIELSNLQGQHDKLECWDVVRKYLMKIDLLDINKLLTNDEMDKAEQLDLPNKHIYKHIYENIKNLKNVKEIRLQN